MYKKAFLTVITHHIAGGDGDVCVIDLIESSITEGFIYALLFTNFNPSNLFIMKYKN